MTDYMYYVTLTLFLLKHNILYTYIHSRHAYVQNYTISGVKMSFNLLTFMFTQIKVKMTEEKC